jgi:phage shock protein A
MGVFTRFRDIINSNMNAMLDKAEDPEKMIKLMIREMEDTLVELKASCAGILAEKKKVRRRLENLQTREDHWEARARLAVDKGRDDLAREALIEKRRFARMVESLEQELVENTALVGQYQDDIRQLEDKIDKAREKQRILVHRHVRAKQAKNAREEIRRMDNYEAIAKFEEFEGRIERMEAEADLVNFGRKPSLDEEFEGLLADDEIENELTNLKASKADQDRAQAE